MSGCRQEWIKQFLVIIYNLFSIEWVALLFSKTSHLRDMNPHTRVCAFEMDNKTAMKITAYLRRNVNLRSDWERVCVCCEVNEWDILIIVKSKSNYFSAKVVRPNPQKKKIPGSFSHLFWHFLAPQKDWLFQFSPTAKISLGASFTKYLRACNVQQFKKRCLLVTCSVAFLQV